LTLPLLTITPHPVLFGSCLLHWRVFFFWGVFFLLPVWVGSAAVEEVPEIGDEPDGAAGGGEAPAGREREAAEGELGAQQRFLMCSLISFPVCCFLCFLFLHYDSGYK